MFSKKMWKHNMYYVPFNAFPSFGWHFQAKLLSSLLGKLKSIPNYREVKPKLKNLILSKI